MKMDTQKISEIAKADTLVIGPGGTKGFIFLGCINYLNGKKLLDNINRYMGVSVGSVICLLLNCGYTEMNILTIAEDINLFDTSSVKSISDMFTSTGIFSLSNLRTKFEKFIFDKLGKIPTLKELYEITGKEFIAVTVNVSKDIPEAIYLNYKNYPNLSCSEACIMSCNIPGAFGKHLYEGNLYIDGALGDPYPVHYESTEKTRVIGLSVISVHNTSTVSGYMLQCIQAPIINLREKILKGLPSSLSNPQENLHLSIKVSMNDNGSMFLTKDEKIQFFIMGYKETKSFLEVSIVKVPEDTVINVDNIDTDEVTYDDD